MSTIHPLDILKARGIEPPSPAIGLVLSAVYAARPPRESAHLWSKLSSMQYPSKRPRQLTFRAGRRSLKTSTLAIIVCLDLIAGGHERYMAQGHKMYGAILAPTQAQAREAIVAVRAFLDAMGIKYSARGDGNVPEIELIDPRSKVQKVVTILTADASSLRGRAVPIAAVDECAFLASGGYDVIKSLRGSQAQFDQPLLILASSSGAPSGAFFEACEKPRKDSLVITAPTWVINHRITREKCLAEAGDDLSMFQIEFESSRWGYSGETWIDHESVMRCVSPDAGLSTPDPHGNYAIGFDFAAVNDSTAIAVCSTRWVEADVTRVVVDAIEEYQGSKANPLPLSAMVDRVAMLSRSFNHAPVRFDQHFGSEVKIQLRHKGVTADTVSMAAHHQSARFHQLRSLILSGRLSIPEHKGLIGQLSTLRVETLPSGSIRVEGARKDDLVDALAIAIEAAQRLPPIEVRGAGIVCEELPFRWNREFHELTGGTRNFYRVLPDGSRLPATPPRGSPEFEDYQANCRALGITPINASDAKPWTTTVHHD